MKTLFSPHIQLTSKVLDLRLQRQNVVMSNLANVATPKYKARRLEFEEDLQAALDLDARGKMTRTSKEHLPSVFEAEGFAATWEKEWHPRAVHGEDRVDLDKEMAIMAKNNLMYNALSTVLKKNFEGLQTVISEGGK